MPAAVAQNFLDSSAVFHKTARKYGLIEECLTLMSEKGWDTQSVLQAARVIDDPQIPVLRRVWKESQALGGFSGQRGTLCYTAVVGECFVKGGLRTKGGFVKG
eukprot:5168192-Amphidinium_carterae.1